MMNLSITAGWCIMSVSDLTTSAPLWDHVKWCIYVSSGTILFILSGEWSALFLTFAVSACLRFERRTCVKFLLMFVTQPDFKINFKTPFERFVSEISAAITILQMWILFHPWWSQHSATQQWFIFPESEFLLLQIIHRASYLMLKNTAAVDSKLDYLGWKAT